MWLAGWAIRALLLVTSPIYYLCRSVADLVSALDRWAWCAIHGVQEKKQPQRETGKPAETTTIKKTAI